MSSVSFDNYAALAGDERVTHLEAAGRYGFQARAERRIVPDVMAKLALQPEDRLLEIGCGPGNLLLPLSHLVAEAWAIDNANAIERLGRRGDTAGRVRLVAGDFLRMPLPEARFSKILVYSVLQYVDSAASALDFVRRAASLLDAGGRLLVGDLPNRSKKARYTASPAGRSAAEEWKANLSGSSTHPLEQMQPDRALVTVDDDLVLGLMRSLREDGLEAYLLPQPPDLPFGNSREDLLVVAPR